MKKSIFISIILSAFIIIPYNSQGSSCKTLLLEWRTNHNNLKESQWLTDYVINYFCATYEAYFQDQEKDSIPMKDILGAALWSEWDVLHANELYRHRSDSPWRQQFEAERKVMIENKAAKILEMFNDTNVKIK